MITRRTSRHSRPNITMIRICSNCFVIWLIAIWVSWPRYQRQYYLIRHIPDYPCLCKNKTKNICSKKCRALDFCALADVLDAIAQINFIYINKNYHLKFIRRIAQRLCEHATWETLFKSQGNVCRHGTEMRPVTLCVGNNCGGNTTTCDEIIYMRLYERR